MIKKILVLSFTLCLMACKGHIPFVYKMDVQQGNLITDEATHELQVGMDKQQVDYLFGTPLMHDSFGEKRFDYVYYLKRQHEPLEQKRLIVYFDDNQRVKSFSFDDMTQGS